jgi:DNA phosphorothioation-dependent restriction protein DptH
LARALHYGKGDLSLARPDLIVVGMAFGGGGTRIHITPVEVKSRLASVFPPSEVEDALSQAKSLSTLLTRLAAQKQPLSAWRLAYQHLLLSIIGFGMRVYSQHQDLGGQLGEWAGFHEQLAAAILGEEECVTVDARGRLIVMDGSLVSEPRDYDGDGFDETIVIGLQDAGRIVAKDGEVFYASVRAKVGDWQLRAKNGRPAPDGGTGGMPLAPVKPDGVSGGAVAPVPTQGGAPSSTRSADKETGSDQRAADGAAAHQEPEGGHGTRLLVGVSERSFEKKEFSLSISDSP